MRSRSRNITICAAYTALGLVLGYIESFIVFPIHVPGIRIGLANIITVLCLYTLGFSYTAIVLVIRVSLSALLFGSPVSFVYSLTGAIIALLGMYSLKRMDFSVYGVSFLGAVLHNISQTIVAYFMVSSVYIFTYLPVLIIWGSFAGLLTGFIANVMIKRISRLTEYDQEVK